MPVLKSKRAPFLAGSVREVFSEPADTNSVIVNDIYFLTYLKRIILLLFIVENIAVWDLH